MTSSNCKDRPALKDVQHIVDVTNMMCSLNVRRHNLLTSWWRLIAQKAKILLIFSSVIAISVRVFVPSCSNYGTYSVKRWRMSHLCSNFRRTRNLRDQNCLTRRPGRLKYRLRLFLYHPIRWCPRGRKQFPVEWRRKSFLVWWRGCLLKANRWETLLHKGRPSCSCLAVVVEWESQSGCCASNSPLAPGRPTNAGGTPIPFAKPSSLLYPSIKRVAIF